VRYELTQFLGDGSIFSTYTAQDRLQGRPVCLRLLRPPFSTDATFVQKLREVVQRYSAVNHPGIETMLDVDDDEGAPFLVSDLTPGMPLEDRIRKLAPFSVPVAVSTAISLCEAMESLHSFGLAHGGIAASNILSLPDGQVRLQLPGIWQAYAASVLATGIMLPAMSPYLAPEISAGGLPSPTGDVYASGVLLYELLTGRLPYNADTPVSMALKHAGGAVPSVRMFNPAVPQVLDEIVKKALSKDVAGRYATAGDLLSDLRVLQDALRFGRAMTWPISRPEPPAAEVPMPKTTASRSEPRSERRPPDRIERDIPLWLSFLIAIFGTAAMVVIGVVIYLNVSKPTLVKVPGLDGLSVEEARQMLAPSKLELSIDSRRSSERVPADHIISCDPDAGEQVREHSKIHVVVSTGSQLTEVPDLSGNSVDQASSILQSAHLTLDDNQETRPSKTVASGLIISQTPSPGKKVDQQTPVKIVVSSGDSDGGSADQARIYTLIVKLVKLTDSVAVRIDIVDALGTRTVLHETEYEPGQTIRLSTRGVGKDVKFRIFYDGQLVSETKGTASSTVEPSTGGDGGGDNGGDTGGGGNDNGGGDGGGGDNGGNAVNGNAQ